MATQPDPEEKFTVVRENVGVELRDGGNGIYQLKYRDNGGYLHLIFFNTWEEAEANFERRQEEALERGRALLNDIENIINGMCGFPKPPHKEPRHGNG